MDKTQLLEKTTSVLMGTHEFQDLARKSVDLIVQGMKSKGVSAAAVFRINQQSQTLYAYAYSAKRRTLIDALLPAKFSQLNLPLTSADNLIVKAAATGQKQQGTDMYAFTRGVLSELAAVSLKKILGANLLISLPVHSKSGKVAGALFLVLKKSVLEADELELFETYAQQLGLAFSNVFAFERLMGAYKKKMQSEEASADEEDIPSIKFTLRLSPRQYKKLNTLVAKSKKTRAEVIREVIDKAE